MTAALLADFVAGGVITFVEVAARRAAFDLDGRQRLAGVLARRQTDPFDLVAGALVVNERLRPELADSQEARALHVVTLSAAGRAGGRDERGQREPWEGVAGQEAFAGEVPVRVEVTLVDV